MSDVRKKVAVHFNFASGQLSVREIKANGKLGALLALVPEICLEDVEFTVDQEKLKKWRQGNKHCRQFAEARGYIISESEKPREKYRNVTFEPKRNNSFMVEAADRKLKPITHSRCVSISRKKIRAI